MSDLVQAFAEDSLRWEVDDDEYDGDKAIREINVARLCLARCKTIMEAKKIADAAEAARVYLERTKASVDTVNEAMEIRAMAEKQMGEYLREAPKNEGAKGNPGGQGAKVVRSSTSTAQTLSDMGITKDESARAQKLAAIPEDEFHRRIEAGKAAGKLTLASVLNPPTQQVVYDASTDEEQVEVIAPEKPAKRRYDSYKLDVGMFVFRSAMEQMETIDPKDVHFSEAHQAMIDFCQDRISKHRTA